MNLFRTLAAAAAFCVTTLAAYAIIDPALQMQTGNPSGATADPANHSRYLIQRPQYALDYDDTTRQANWVAWNYTTADTGSAGRSSVFFQDTTLPAGFYQVLTTDYSGSGYDRGHMTPSGDRTATRADNDATFYMSNMIPQAPDNNQGVWASFENYTRSLAAAGHEILLISGPSLFGGSTLASGVAIPGYTWKIALVVPLGGGTALSRVTAATRIITIKVPNTAGVRSTPWESFRTSVAQIESDTGYTFLTALDPGVRATLRLVVDGQSVTGAPSIVAQPAAQSAPVGGTATFSVIANGDAPLGYQWLKDETEIPGATNATLTLASVQASDIATYTVVVTNNVGAVTSNGAALVVSGLPPSITTSPAGQTVGAGSSVTFAVSALGSPTLTYQWRKIGTPIGSATNSTLTLANVQSADAASYDVVVTNNVGFATSAAATLVVNPAAPTITAPPVARTANTGDNASFTVTASGSATLGYQWRKTGIPLVNGGAISGATSATLVLTGVAAVDAGSYDVVVTNGLGTATSTAAILTVNPPPPSTVGWTFGPATAATADPTSGLTADITGGTLTQRNNFGTTVLLSTTSASTGTGASGAFNAGAATVNGALNTATSTYFEFTLAPSAGKRLLATGLSLRSRSTGTGPQALAVYSSVDGFASALATMTNASGTNWALYTPAFTPVLGATGTPVTFRIYGYNGTGAVGSTAVWRIDDLSLTINAVFPPPVAPVVTGTTPISGAAGVAIAAPITITFNEPVSFTGAWFAITSATNGPVAAAVSGGPITFTLTPPSLFAYNDTVTVTVLGARVVDQASGSIPGTADTTFSFATETYVPPTPPTVTTQPVAQNVTAGAGVSFTVAASGTAPLNYQWRKNLLNLTGNSSATTATLTLASTTPADAGSYDCVVTNVAGSDVSQAAALTVTVVPPTITTPPVAQSATVGGSATFTVAAAGTAPLSYQWRKNGAPISGNASAATATLVLTALTHADSGSYDVIVTNLAGAATSAAGSLAVLEAAPGTIYWDFATANPTSGLPAGVTGGTVTQGNNNGTTALLTTVSVSSGYAGASGTNNAGAAARIGPLVKVGTATTGSAYFEFTFTPDAGRQFAASALTFGTRSTGTGPQAYAVFSSVDGFTNPVATGAIANNSTWRLITTPFAGITGAAGAPVTFRLYGYNGAGGATANTANWRIDDVKLTAGLLALPPVPPTIVTPPLAQIATVGDTVTLTVAATGTAPLAYQWRKGGIAIADNTSAATATLTLPTITTADAGEYDCVVSNIAGTATSNPAALTVNKANLVVTLTGLTATYNGLPKTVTGSTAPVTGLTVDITYDGSSTAPTNAGSYTVVGTVNDPNYTGTTTQTLAIAQASQALAFNLPPTMTFGTTLALSATSTAGLPVSFSLVSGPATITGNIVTVTGAGTVVVRAAQAGNANYLPAGPVDRSIAVGKAMLTAKAHDATRVYGTPNSAFTIQYTGFVNGDTAAVIDTAPVATTLATPTSDVGTYPITVAGGADDNYTFTYTSGVLTITPAPQTIAFGPLASRTYGDAPFSLSATSSSGLPVTFSVVSGPVTVAGSTVTITGAGTATLRASQSGNNNYSAAASVDRSFLIDQALAPVVLGNLNQVYDGTPKPVTATTTPAGLAVSITYDGSATAPTYPGTYAVVATISDPNYTGTASGSLVITVTALVRRAPSLDGGLDGSLQVLTGESFALNGNAYVSGDILVPGLPQVRLNGRPTFVGTRDGTGSATPSGYQVTLNGNAVLRYLIRRTDPLALPAVAAPPAPTGTRNVALNSANASAGDFATIRDLTLNGNAGNRAIPAGTYGNFVANGNSGFVLGVAGATTPAVYQLQGLTLNGNAQVQVVGPVVIVLANSVSLDGPIGAANHPEWLTLAVASGGVTLNGNSVMRGNVIAPNGSVTINGNATLTGTVAADRLTISGNGLLQQPTP